MHFEDLKDKDRDLAITALRALHKERLEAFAMECTYRSRINQANPNPKEYGLDEVNDALKRAVSGYRY